MDEKDIRLRMARMRSDGDQLMETIVDNYTPGDLERLFDVVSLAVEDLPLLEVDKETVRVFFLNGMLQAAEIRQRKEEP
jgi:hypothetical protein